ncbi:MAG: hypothetical protein HOJ16_00340 [Candidatus Peribacter sp.]|jgi:hypothetical protein|nr:hypothetical protein [Candidatus Peribacter sp.]
MFRDIKIIEDSETRVVVRARIERRRMAKDPYITASADNLRAELLKERPELDFSSFKCSKQNVLCNYTEPPLLETDFVFEKPRPKKTPVTKVKRVLTETQKTDIVQVESENGTTPAPAPASPPAPTTRKRSRVSTKKQQENKLLGTQNLE